MSKKNNKKTVLMIGPLQKGQNTRPRARKTRKQKKKSAVPHALHEAICSNYDPFCSAAVGAKLHDRNTSPSLTFHTKSITPIVTDAAGYAFTWVTPDPLNAFNKGTIVAGNVTAYVNLSNEFYNTLVGPGIANQWRVVSYGCKYYTTQSWTNATGLIITSEINGNYTATTGLSVTTTTLGSIVKSMPLRDANIQFIGRPRGVEAEDYEALAGAGDLGYTTWAISMSGATVSTTVGYLELIVNYEWIPYVFNAYNQLATAAAPHNPAVMDGRARVAEKVSPINFTGSLDQVRGAMVNAAAVGKEVQETVKTASNLYQTVKPLIPAARLVGGLLL